MQRNNYSIIARLLILGCMIVIAVWALTGGFSARQATPPSTDVANVPQAQQQGKGQAPAVPVVPAPQGTRQIPLPITTPSRTPLPSTPTPAPLQAAAIITPSLVTSVTMGLTSVDLMQKDTVNGSEALQALTWAPTGDKLLYATKSGKLYWSNLDGTNASLLHTYDSRPDSFFQRPMSDTLILTHSSPQPNQSHMDVIHFVLGQPPTLAEVYEAGAIFDLTWWSPDRASGITLGSYVGGEKLVTLDANGHKIAERNIPYMISASIRPGGDWLAYTTDQQSTSTPFHGSDPETTYMLNLNTGQRLQISASGKGHGVGSWSPDGNWLLTGVGLVSVDGQETVLLPPGGGRDWSPDSKQLAYYVQRGGCDAEDYSPCPPYTSDVYIIDVPARKASDVTKPASAPNSTNMMMQPRWSPDGSLLALLSFDSMCVTTSGVRCSSQVPAIYLTSRR